MSLKLTAVDATAVAMRKGKCDRCVSGNDVAGVSYRAVSSAGGLTAAAKGCQPSCDSLVDLYGFRSSLAALDGCFNSNSDAEWNQVGDDQCNKLGVAAMCRPCNH